MKNLKTCLSIEISPKPDTIIRNWSSYKILEGNNVTFHGSIVLFEIRLTLEFQARTFKNISSSHGSQPTNKILKKNNFIYN